MRVESLPVGDFAANCYLYSDPDTCEAIIIDPGAEAETIAQKVAELKLRPTAMVLTHGHSDHIGAVRQLKEHFAVPLFAGRLERELLVNPVANLSAFFGASITAPEADRWLDDEDVVMIGRRAFTILHVPGHSPGSICLLDAAAGICFCGDVLFAGSIGRTDFPGGSHELLVEGIRKKLLRLPDGIICYPGHGSPTTIGAERRTNPFLTGGEFA